MIQRSTLKLNGIIYEYISPLSLTELLDYLGFNHDVILIDYNGTIIQKQNWNAIKVQNQDNIEILTLAGGG